MKAAWLVAACLATVASPALAEWIEVGINKEGDTFYMDPSTLKKKANHRSVWAMADYKDGTSAKTHWKGDCMDDMMQMTYGARYDGRMGKGTLVDSWKTNAEPSPVIPGSLSAALLKLMCGAKP